MIRVDEVFLKFAKRYTIYDDHWIWQGPFHEKGYGLFLYSWKGKKYRHYAHRYSYIMYSELTFIPHGYDLHHVCEIPACVNPDHLIPVTNTEHRKLHK